MTECASNQNSSTLSVTLLSFNSNMRGGGGGGGGRAAAATGLQSGSGDVDDISCRVQ